MIMREGKEEFSQASLGRRKNEGFIALGQWSLRQYYGEFDPGSGWTLAAGLIHASRTVSVVAILYESDVRVRNTYATYPLQEDSSGKLELTLHEIIE